MTQSENTNTTVTCSIFLDFLADAFCVPPQLFYVINESCITHSLTCGSRGVYSSQLELCRSIDVESLAYSATSAKAVASKDGWALDMIGLALSQRAGA